MARMETVVSAHSEFQKILITRDAKGLFLTLNGEPQVHSHEERLYHESVATMPMLLARHIDSILILGGGDGLAARDILAFPDAKKITLVELDPMMIQLWSEHPELRAMNEGSLTNPRLKVVVGDAIQWFLNTRQTFDVIIQDAEITVTGQPREVTAERAYKFHMLTHARLRPGGIWQTVISDDDDIVVQDGLFEVYRDQLPQTTQRAYPRKRSPISKTRVLLDAVFPHVRQWTIRFPILTTHSSFYVSDAPIRQHRKPARPMLRPKAVQNLA